jgi:hypothetical protein
MPEEPVSGDHYALWVFSGTGQREKFLVTKILCNHVISPTSVLKERLSYVQCFVCYGS